MLNLVQFSHKSKNRTDVNYVKKRIMILYFNKGGLSATSPFSILTSPKLASPPSPPDRQFLLIGGFGKKSAQKDKTFVIALISVQKRSRNKSLNLYSQIFMFENKNYLWRRFIEQGWGTRLQQLAHCEYWRSTRKIFWKCHCKFPRVLFSLSYVVHTFFWCTFETKFFLLSFSWADEKEKCAKLTQLFAPSASCDGIHFLRYKTSNPFILLWKSTVGKYINIKYMYIK